MADVAASFRARGFVALQLLTSVELEALRAECDSLNGALEAEGRDLCEEDCVLDVLADLPAETAAARSDADAYFAERLEGRRPEHAAAIRGLLMQRLPAVARLLLDDCEAGGAPCLFNEHYVRKPARVAGPFSWHTDVAHQHEATLALGGASAAPADYISAWCAVRQESASPMTPALRCLDAQRFPRGRCALDDIDESNGALLLLPRDGPQPPGDRWHEPPSDANAAWLATEGVAHAHASLVPAGTAVVFSSRSWHASAPNLGDADRRAFYVQYSAAPITGALGGGVRAPLAFAVRTEPTNPPSELRAVALPRASTSGLRHAAPNGQRQRNEFVDDAGGRSVRLKTY